MIAPDVQAFAKWDPKQLQAQQRRGLRKYLYRAGGFVRQTARRSLRKARKIRKSELDADARAQYDRELKAFKDGKRDRPPVLGDIISQPGQPPKLHQSPSALRTGLLFSVDQQAATVVIGPKRDKDGIAGDLEFGRGKIKNARPFMQPAFVQLQARLPEIFQNSFR